MKNLTALALLGALSFAFPGAASALPVTVNLGDGAYYELGGTVEAANVDLNSLPAAGTLPPGLFGSDTVSGVQLDRNLARIENGSGPRLFGLLSPTAPAGTTDNYLAVYGRRVLGVPLVGQAVFTLASGITSFAFNWGTVDRYDVDNYNVLKVENGDGDVYTITGGDVLTNSLNSLVAGVSTEYFRIFDPAGIAKVTLQSRMSAFEIADIRAVPLPAALPMFGAALVGLGVLRRRRGARAVG